MYFATIEAMLFDQECLSHRRVEIRYNIEFADVLEIVTYMKLRHMSMLVIINSIVSSILQLIFQ
jgi:hypothetical protein